MKFWSLLLEFTNVVWLTQLIVFILYLNTKATANRLLAIILAGTLIPSSIELYFKLSPNPTQIEVFYPYTALLWELQGPLMLHFVIELIEEKYTYKKLLISISYIILIPDLLYQFFSRIYNFEHPLGIYYSIFLNIGFVLANIYLLKTSTNVRNNYRVHKQVKWIIRACISGIVLTGIPWYIVLFSGNQDYIFLVSIGIPISFSMIVYGFYKYRLQSISTSRIAYEMIEQASGFNLLTAPDGTIISASNTALTFCGFDKEELVEKNIFDITANKPTLEKEIQLIQSQVNYSPTFEIEVKTKTNSKSKLKLSINGIRNQFNELLGYYFIFFGPIEELQKIDQIQSEYQLSNREKEVALLLAKGNTNQEIADQLFISMATVKTHSHNIYQKTNTKNKLELKSLVELT